MAIITLLTDFGTSDSYVAEVKGVLLARAPGVTLVDGTHQGAPGDGRAGQPGAHNERTLLYLEVHPR